VLRTGRKGLAAATLLLDGGKGAVAVLIGHHWGPDMAILAGAGAMLGHLFPVWLKFRGGKGVATAGGVLLALDWRIGLIAGAIWLLVAIIFRYSSLAALVAAAVAPAVPPGSSPRADRGRRPVPGGADLAAPSPEYPPPADGAGAKIGHAKMPGLGSR
jgi:acyl-phosphate glycerol 3-phosphate acyltransferase